MKDHQYIPIPPQQTLLIGLLFKLLKDAGNRTEIFPDTLQTVLDANLKLRVLAPAKKDHNGDVIYEETGEPVIDESRPLVVELVPGKKLVEPVEKFPGVPGLLVN